MANAVIGWENRLLTASLTAGSQVASLPVSNLQTDQGDTASAWQTNGVVASAAGAWLIADAGSPVTWRAFALARTNLSTAAQVRWRVGDQASIIEAAPVLDLDFINGSPGTPAGWTITRSGAAGLGEATFWDSTGSLLIAGANSWRVTHDPVTLQRLGLLWEPGRTNRVRNPRGVGAADGSPGTAPTNWSVAGAGGLSAAVAGTGTENGLPFVDVRVTGTAVAGNTSFLQVNFETATAIAAALGQAWTFSTFAKLGDGALGPPTSVLLFMAEKLAGGGANGQQSTSASVPNAASRLSAQRMTATWTVNNAGGGTTAFVQPIATFYFNFSGAVNTIIRLAVPQMEQGECVTTPILPPSGTVAAATRPADNSFRTGIMTGTTFATLALEAVVMSTTRGTTNRRVSDARLYNSSGNSNMLMEIRDTGTGLLYTTGYSWSDDMTFGPIAAKFITSGTPFRFAQGTAPNDQAAYTDGMANIFYSEPGTHQPLDSIIINSSAFGVVCYRRIRAYSSRLSNAQLMALTSTGSSLTTPAYDSGTIAAGVQRGYMQSVHVAPAEVTGQFCACYLDDPANPDGFLSIPLAYAGPAWQPNPNIGWDSAPGRQDATDETVTRSGQEFPLVLYQRRTYDLSLANVRAAELWPRLMELDATARRAGNILFVPDPDSADRGRETIFGRCRPAPRVTYAARSTAFFAWSAQITERL